MYIHQALSYIKMKILFQPITAYFFEKADSKQSF